MKTGLLISESDIYRKLLEDRNISKVAKKIGVTQPTLFTFYRGTGQGSERTLKGLRQYFTEDYKLWSTYHTLTKSLDC